MIPGMPGRVYCFSSKYNLFGPENSRFLDKFKDSEPVLGVAFLFVS